MLLSSTEIYHSYRLMSRCNYMTIVKHMIRFPADVYAKLRQIAEKEERSINWTVVAAVKQYVEQYERQHGTLPVQPGGEKQT